MTALDSPPTRPLTVADRTPEVGDVLTCAYGNGDYQITAVPTGKLTDTSKILVSFMGDEGDLPFWAMEYDTYSERADLGPVTVEVEEAK